MKKQYQKKKRNNALVAYNKAKPASCPNTECGAPDYKNKVKMIQESREEIK